MSASAARRWIFVGLVLLVPLPMLPLLDFGALVPVVRYALLGGVASVYGLSEGVAGPVGGLIFVFFAHAVVYGVAGWLLAWLAARGLVHLPARARGALVLGALVAGLAWSLAFEPYRTPFGRAPTANLWSVLS